MSSRVENTQFKIQSSIPKESTPLNIDRIESDNYSEEELSIVKNYVINSREFNPDNLKGIPARFADNNIYRIRDFNDDEKTNAAKSFIDLREAGMPIDIFSDLQFMGAHVKDDRFKTFNPAYGVYIPEFAGITMSPVSGISNLGFKNVLGSKIHARDTMIHELGHHIDFTIGRDLSKSSSIYTPITDRSPLFDLPKVEIINNKVVIDENTGALY